MSYRCCPTCGQRLPSQSPLPKQVHFSPGQQRIVDRVRRAGPNGIPSDELLSFVYADDPDGGPLWANATLHTRIWQINRKLRKIGKVIRAPRGGHGRGGPGTYTYRTLTDGAAPQDSGRSRTVQGRVLHAHRDAAAEIVED